MKKSILIMLLSIGILNINAQCCASPTISTANFTIYSINFTVTYMDCNNGSVTITNVVANGSSVKGNLAFVYAIQGFFKHNPRIKTIGMNASCKRWVQNGKTLNPSSEGPLFLVSYELQNCASGGGCCTFKNNDSGMNEAALSEAEMHQECQEDDCFEICQEY